MRNSKYGFTIVEISITLIIISLLFVTVSVGGDLIRSAKQRAEINQLDKFNTATTIFRDVYSVLPGDMSDARAASYFNNTFDASLTRANGGNEDGYIYAYSASLHDTPPVTRVDYETDSFFYHLYLADLIQNIYVPIDGGSTTMGVNLPSTIMNPSAGILPYTDSDINNYFFYGLQNSADNTIQLAPAFDALDADSIDKKIDDGIPDAGRVKTVFLLGTSWPVTALSSDTCTANSGVFNGVTTPEKGLRICGLQIKMLLDNYE